MTASTARGAVVVDGGGKRQRSIGGGCRVEVRSLENRPAFGSRLVVGKVGRCFVACPQ